MIDRTNILRTVKAHNERLLISKEKRSMWSMFTSEELRILWRYIRPNRFKMLLMSALSFIVAVAEGGKAVALIMFIKSLVATKSEVANILTFTVMHHKFDFSGYSIFSTKIGLMASIFVVLFCLTLLTAGLTLLITYLTQVLTLSLKRESRVALIGKLFSFNLEYFSQARSGELLQLHGAETNRFSNIVSVANEFIKYGIQSLIFIVMLFYIFWNLTLLVLFSALVFFYLHIWIDLKLKYYSGKLHMAEANQYHLFHQIIYGITMIKIGGLERRELNQFTEEHKKQEKYSIAIGLLFGVSRVSQEIGITVLTLISVLFLYFFSNVDALFLDPGQFLAYLFLLLRAMPAASGLQHTRTMVFSTYAPLARIMRLLNTPDGPDADKLLEDESKKQHLNINKISVHDIYFNYNNEKKVLDDVSLNFEAGKLNALVGFSGSGKSTLLDIMSVLRYPSSGEIRIDGKTLEKQNLPNYRFSIGYMNQDPIIFHDTIRTNVRYYKPNATDEEIWQALDMAEASGFVKKFPEGLDTGLGERGVTISGGERQRIGLSRVFLQDAPILLLDEATNALDYDTEYKIYKNLKKGNRDKIVVMAAHRLIAIKDFDQIIVMRAGKVVEVGTHVELMNKEGFYYALYTIQNQYENG